MTDHSDCFLPCAIKKQTISHQVSTAKQRETRRANEKPTKDKQEIHNQGLNGSLLISIILLSPCVFSDTALLSDATDRPNISCPYISRSGIAESEQDDSPWNTKHHPDWYPGPKEPPCLILSLSHTHSIHCFVSLSLPTRKEMRAASPRVLEYIDRSNEGTTIGRKRGIEGKNPTKETTENLREDKQENDARKHRPSQQMESSNNEHKERLALNTIHLHLAARPSLSICRHLFFPPCPALFPTYIPDNESSNYEHRERFAFGSVQDCPPSDCKKGTGRRGRMEEQKQIRRCNETSSKRKGSGEVGERWDGWQREWVTIHHQSERKAQGDRGKIRVMRCMRGQCKEAKSKRQGERDSQRYEMDDKRKVMDKSPGGWMRREVIRLLFMFVLEHGRRWEGSRGNETFLNGTFLWNSDYFPCKLMITPDARIIEQRDRQKDSCPDEKAFEEEELLAMFTESKPHGQKSCAKQLYTEDIVNSGSNHNTKSTILLRRRTETERRERKEEARR